MSLLEHALALAKKGFRVFPLVPLSKRPIFDRYHQRSTTNPTKIQGWWQHNNRTRKYNIGIHLPGILVVDIDGPIGEDSFEKLTEDHPCPPTAEVASGSGRHLYYSLPAGLRAIPRPLDLVPGFEPYDKIDIKGSGGLVAGPGSIHKSGTTYTWVNEPETISDLTPAPAWMIEQLCGPEQPKYLQEIDSDDEGVIEEANSDRILLETCLKRWPFVAKEGAKRGSRHEQTGKIACWLLGRGVTQRKAQEVGEQWLMLQGRDDDEALGDLERTLARAYKGLEDGTTSLMIDHQRAAVDSYLKQFPTDEERERTRNALRVLCHYVTSLSSLEELFLESLLVHVHYETVTCGNNPDSIPMTYRQLKRVHELLNPKHKIGGVKTLYKLLDQFVSMNEKKAKQFEVLVMLSKGKLGSSSVYSCPVLLKNPKALTGVIGDYQSTVGGVGANRVREGAPAAAQHAARGSHVARVSAGGEVAGVVKAGERVRGVRVGGGGAADLKDRRGLVVLGGSVRAGVNDRAGRGDGLGGTVKVRGSAVSDEGLREVREEAVGAKSGGVQERVPVSGLSGVSPARDAGAAQCSTSAEAGVGGAAVAVAARIGRFEVVATERPRFGVSGESEAAGSGVVLGPCEAEGFSSVTTAVRVSDSELQDLPGVGGIRGRTEEDERALEQLIAFLAADED